MNNRELMEIVGHVNPSLKYNQKNKRNGSNGLSKGLSS